MNSNNQKTKQSISDLENNLNSLNYDCMNSNETYKKLDSMLQQAIDIIPGYIENVRVILALKICRRDIGSESSQRSESDFNFIKIHLIENLEKVKYCPHSY